MSRCFGASEKQSRVWSQVVSRADAEALAASGDLEPLFLLPERFGGDNRPENVVFVPAGINDVRDEYLDSVAASLVEDGVVDQMTATPEYRGDSFIPSAIVVRLSHLGRRWRRGAAHRDLVISCRWGLLAPVAARSSWAARALGSLVDCADQVDVLGLLEGQPLANRIGVASDFTVV